VPILAEFGRAICYVALCARLVLRFFENLFAYWLARLQRASQSSRCALFENARRGAARALWLAGITADAHRSRFFDRDVRLRRWFFRVFYQCLLPKRPIFGIKNRVPVGGQKPQWATPQTLARPA
jgi:hypothetical protein